MSKFIPRDEWLKLYEHPKWQKKRLEILEYAEWQCQGCGDREKQLHVHHARYLRGKKPWEYRNGWLTAMCWSCHKKLHGKDDELIDPTGMQKATPEREIRPANAAAQCPDHLKPVWLGVMSLVKHERKLISQWMESGCLLTLGSPGAEVAEIGFPPAASFAKDFLEQGHADFVEACFASILGRKVPVLFVNAEEVIPTGTEEKATARFGVIFDMLGKL